MTSPLTVDLSGKTAVITGGSSGIGLATVDLFLRSGANVAFCGRSEDRLREAEAGLVSFNFSILCSR